MVPLPIIQQAIRKFEDGSIINYVYNAELQALEEIEVVVNARVKTDKADLAGLDIMTLSIKQVFFDDILIGDKDIEYRTLTPTTMSRLTRFDKSTDKRYVRQPQVLRLYCGYTKDHDLLYVEVKRTEFVQPDSIMYHLGKVLEYDIKKTTAERLEIAKG